MIDEAGDNACPRPWKPAWGRLLESLVLVRLGQELGSDTRTAQAVATVIDVCVAVIGRFWP